ncbi:hypothetical protein GJ633_09930 [Halorubrum sp. CBA1125]|uniref:hypothetical protein n=1 Tax=Halorubrum sp. CBA1125 TaxID=2668072 RepID=UPI0012E73DD3|nr:hypothetical protein [Halorubrum sp. CBA1125]MUW14947.1 hypothetical protein [Halorubrum sp. CBA1125]
MDPGEDADASVSQQDASGVQPTDEDDAGEEAAQADEDGEFADPAGIAVEAVSINRIVESFDRSQIVADVVVRNTGDRTYGTLELRVDAFYEPPEDDRTYHPPRVDERTAVGRTYVEREFEGFATNTRTFDDIVIRYDADADANGSTDPAEFDLEIAVRRAEPL